MGETNNALEAFGVKIEQMRGNFDEEIKVWWGNDYPEGDIPAEVVPEADVPAEVVPEDDDSEVPLTEEEIAEAESAINPAEVVPDVEAETCTKELNPSEEDRTYSSGWSNRTDLYDESGSMLDSDAAWSAVRNGENEWIVIDASKEESIGGVLLQGRSSLYGHQR